MCSLVAPEDFSRLLTGSEAGDEHKYHAPSPPGRPKPNHQTSRKTRTSLIYRHTILTASFLRSSLLPRQYATPQNPHVLELKCRSANELICEDRSFREPPRNHPRHWAILWNAMQNGWRGLRVYREVRLFKLKPF